MHIFIVGIDGYLGWPLAMHLAKLGHEVQGIDNLSRRTLVKSVGSTSAIPIIPLKGRVEVFEELYKIPIVGIKGDVANYPQLVGYFQHDFKPDAIVHLGEMPSAPYSMKGFDEASWTVENNVIGTLSLLWAMRETCPEAQLVKLGTMGEWGQPNVDIPEGWFELEHRERKDRMLFPKCPGSLYHGTKCADSINVEFACRVWGLRSTDIMQGVVYGTRTDEIAESGLATRFDLDHCFGTAINRFVAQAVINHPITPYGHGGQARGFLPLRDSIQCMTLAILNPPEAGEYRVFNQLEDVYGIKHLAELVYGAAGTMGLFPKIEYIENPRVEVEGHYYNPDHRHLLDLGYKPTANMQDELKFMFEDLLPHRERIEKVREMINPQIKWK